MKKTSILISALVLAAWNASAGDHRQPTEWNYRAGAKLYARECAACHGADREGLGKAPPLNRPEITQAPPEALFSILRNGSLRRGMPSFAQLPEAQRQQIIIFLKGLPALPPR